MALPHHAVTWERAKGPSGSGSNTTGMVAERGPWRGRGGAVCPGTVWLVGLVGSGALTVAGFARSYRSMSVFRDINRARSEDDGARCTDIHDDHEIIVLRVLVDQRT